jgi:cytochrome c oxidase cbb3-type subunit IV
MTLEQATQVSELWGLVILGGLFLAAVVYALWPKNKREFEQAARAPLESENDDE